MIPADNQRFLLQGPPQLLVDTIANANRLRYSVKAENRKSNRSWIPFIDAAVARRWPLLRQNWPQHWQIPAAQGKRLENWNQRLILSAHNQEIR